MQILNEDTSENATHTNEASPLKKPSNPAASVFSLIQKVMESKISVLIHAGNHLINYYEHDKTRSYQVVANKVSASNNCGLYSHALHSIFLKDARSKSENCYEHGSFINEGVSLFAKTLIAT